MTKMIRKMKAVDVSSCKEMILESYNQYVAPDYGLQGNQHFYDFVDGLLDRLKENHSTFVYEEDGIIGMIEWVDHHIALLFVDPMYHQKGIAKKLFHESIHQLNLQGRIDVNSSPYAVDAYRHLGFVPYDLMQEKNGIIYMPMQQFITSAKMRSETMHDFEVIDHINNTAFGQVGEANLIRNLRKSDHFNPELSILAIQDQQAIGHILFTEVITDTYQKFDLLALAPMAVCSKHQNQLVGSALITEGLKRAYDLGYKGVVVLGHSRYYPKFGFKKASDFDIHCPFPVPDDVYMVYPLYDHALDDIKGTIIYPDAFSEV